MLFHAPPIRHRFAKAAQGPGAAWVQRMDAKMRRKMQAPLARELGALKRQVKLGKLERAVAAEDSKRVVELSLVDQVGSIVASVGEALQDPLLEGVNIAIQELGIKGIAVDMFRPRLERWLDRHTAQMISQVNGTSRGAVREMMRDGIRRGRHPRSLAKDIRQIVGLTEPQSVAVARRRQAMVDDGVPEADIERRMGRYAERLLKQRARIIAQHETMMAINGGRHELWKQLAKDGELEPGAQRQWLTAVDEMVCPICRPMHEQVTTITGQYETPKGNMVDHPPAHVACRCTEVLI